MATPASIRIGTTAHKGKGLFARRPLRAGESIFAFVGTVLSDDASDNESLQIAGDLFLQSTEGFDNYLNHSCSPNCFIDFQNLTLVALKDIARGDELGFDYTTSDYDLVATGTSFSCFCGSPQCIGVVQGFKYLTREQKSARESYLAPYLKAHVRETV